MIYKTSLSDVIKTFMAVTIMTSQDNNVSIATVQ